MDDIKRLLSGPRVLTTQTSLSPLPVRCRLVMTDDIKNCGTIGNLDKWDLTSWRAAGGGYFSM
eukprot:scaffold62399_cov20-Cyclotella_meneghiniana.AAC.1